MEADAVVCDCLLAHGASDVVYLHSPDYRIDFCWHLAAKIATLCHGWKCEVEQWQRGQQNVKLHGRWHRKFCATSKRYYDDLPRIYAQSIRSLFDRTLVCESVEISNFNLDDYAFACFGSLRVRVGGSGERV
jgi:hypothetical protein